MNRLESLPIMAIRRELKDICQRMIRIAYKTGAGKGYHVYDDQDPEYQRLSKTRDYLCAALRKEWNRQS
jgi:hypothetical protein